MAARRSWDGMSRESQRMQVDVDITRTREVSASRSRKTRVNRGLKYPEVFERHVEFVWADMTQD